MNNCFQVSREEGRGSVREVGRDESLCEFGRKEEGRKGGGKGRRE